MAKTNYPNLYRISKGKKVKISQREMKSTIMRVNNWTETQYRKNYDIIKNKLRAYESFTRAQGVKVTQQSPVAFIYKMARAKETHGANYKPSIAVERIMSFSSLSITQGRKYAAQKGSKFVQRGLKIYEQSNTAAFTDFINKVPKAAELARKIDNPVKLEEALKALAEHIHAQQKPSGEIFESGETFGSDELGEDFDISPWLE